MDWRGRTKYRKEETAKRPKVEAGVDEQAPTLPHTHTPHRERGMEEASGWDIMKEEKRNKRIGI